MGQVIFRSKVLNSLQNNSWPSADTGVWKDKKVGLEFQEQFFTTTVPLKMKTLGEYMEGKQD